jgi:hypothetical protein
MKRTIIFAAIVIVTLTGLPAGGAVDTESLSGPYFGQTPPDTIPQLFAPGIISDAGYRLHGVPAFSPDGCEVFWPAIPPKLMHMYLTDSGWSAPEEITFESRGVGFPVFSTDGRRMYFQAARADGEGSMDIWYLEKSEEGWSEPHNLGSPPNSESMESQPSLTESNDLVFTGKLEGVGLNRGIFYCKYEDGSFNKPVLLGESINTPAIEYTPFVSSGGDYLLFCSSRPSVKEADLKLYVSFRNGSGTWSPPKGVSQALGLERAARFPAISADGKYLFYLSRGNIYWVSANIINTLRNRVPAKAGITGPSLE